MFSFSDQLKHQRELFKVVALSGSQLILLKERNDLVSQVSNRSNTEAIKLLSVIIAATIDKDLSTFKELFEIMQMLASSFHLELRRTQGKLASP